MEFHVLSMEKKEKKLRKLMARYLLFFFCFAFNFISAQFLVTFRTRRLVGWSWRRYWNYKKLLFRRQRPGTSFEISTGNLALSSQSNSSIPIKVFHKGKEHTIIAQTGECSKEKDLLRIFPSSRQMIINKSRSFFALTPELPIISLDIKSEPRTWRLFEPNLRRHINF